MDDSLGKVAIEVTGKVVESVAAPLARKVLSWISPGGKLRPVQPRGRWERRQGEEDRRILGVPSRLRAGFWLEYHRRSGAGKTEVIEILTLEKRRHLFQALVTEGRHYRFSDRTSDTTLLVSTIAAPAIDVVWMQWNQRPKEDRQAVLIVEGIADYLLANYNVSALHRRKNQRRAVAAS